MKVVAVAAVLLSACTHQLGAISTLPAAALSGDEVTVARAGSEPTAATIVAGPHDAFALYDEAGHEIPVAQVQRITHTSRGYGALEGLGIGLLSGVVAGAAMGFADGDDPPCDSSGGSWCLFVLSAGDKAVLLGSAFGGVGAIVGAIVGAMIGQDDVWSTGPDEIRPIAQRHAPAGPRVTASAGGFALHW